MRRAAQRPQAPSATASSHASRWCRPGASSHAAAALDEGPLLGVDHRPLVGVEDARGARVDHHHPGVAEITAEAPARDARVTVGATGEVAQQLLRVGDLPHGGEEDVLGELGGAQVADVLVDPVGDEGADDPLLPPVLGADLLQPLLARVPVVDDVVVVEDHRVRDGGHQPADRRLAPRQLVGERVLLEVGDLLALDQVAHPRVDLVGVDLVAEVQQGARPFLRRAVAELEREGAQRAHLAALVVLVLGQGVRRLVRIMGAARAEDDVDRPAPDRGADDALGPVVALGPDALAVEMDLVRRRDAGLEAGHVHERVVVPADGEGPPLAAEDVDRARTVRLHPHGCFGPGGVAENGTEHQRRHAGNLASRGCAEH
jgi:hypothetical protein